MNILLGYSESVLSRVIDVLQATDEVIALQIIQNIPVETVMDYCPTTISSEIILHSHWQPSEQDQYLFSVATPSIKKLLFDFFVNEKKINPEQFRKLVHPSAIISSSVSAGKGLFVEPGSIITSYTSLGFGVTVNRNVSIGHHCTIGDFVTINPGVNMAGHCTIGNGVQIGIGATVFDHISIGEGSVIGGGSVVTKNIPAGVKAWGNPCKVVASIN
ncbi:hypothetical protein [Lacibacter sp. H407]|uniref:hypothetical protein n=1 Tax=Lacibacter sp. H407 TaxID=3133423 RepID=UPI0030C57B4D